MKVILFLTTLFLGSFIISSHVKASNIVLSCQDILLISDSNSVNNIEMSERMESIINELVAVYRIGYSQSKTNWGFVIANSFISEKQMEIEKKFGKKTSDIIFKKVQFLVMKEIAEMADPEGPMKIEKKRKLKKIIVRLPSPSNILDIQNADSVVLSPDGKNLLTNSGKDVKIWEVSSGNFLFALSGPTHTHMIVYKEYSPDGQYIITSSADNLAKVWNATTGHFLFDLKGHSARVNSARFSPDGLLLERKAWVT